MIAELMKLGAVEFRRGPQAEPCSPREKLGAWVLKSAAKTAPVPAAPCVGCGDKRNIAEVKASPAAQEEMLRG